MNRTLDMASAEISEDDIRSVVNVLRSGRLALGPESERFEHAVADYVGVEHAIAVSSGTAGLHLVLLGLGIGKGDEVLVPSFTFAASVNAILYVGAEPVFVDIDRDTFNLDPADVEQRVTERTKAIMAVDVFGHPVDWPSIQRIASWHGLLVIDDCCEALGAELDGQRVGSFGNAGCFAFYPNKQITTGEGGMIVTNDEDLAVECRSLRNQGRGTMGKWLEHDRLGYNYRMNEMSAALGASQVARIEEFIERREAVARAYSTCLEGIAGVRAPIVDPHVRMSWFVYVVLLEQGLHREPVMETLARRGIPSRGYFSPIHRQPYLRERFREVHLPVTESIADRTIALPFHTRMAGSDVEYVSDALRDAV